MDHPEAVKDPLEPAGGRSLTLRFATLDAGFARVFVAATERGLCSIGLDARRGRSLLLEWVRRHAPGARVVEDAAALRGALEQIAAYGRGELKRFDLPLDLRGTPFQRRVWSALREIPYGATRTYGEVAARIGSPGAARAVGGATGANPLPVIVPCHRLVAADGLGGFSGGLHHKRRLLALEGVLLEPARA
jgi:O-6-methylguanine DNA methyltransferase